MFRNQSLFIIALLMVPASLGYMYSEGRTYEVTNLHIAGFPGKLIFVSDPHLKDGNIRNIEKVVNGINAMQPDVVLIGGDFTYPGEDDISLNRVWRKVDAPVYAVLGNHDYGSGIGPINILKRLILLDRADMRPETYDVSVLQGEGDMTFAGNVVKELTDDGVRVLRNEVETISINGYNVTIVGLDDCWAGQTKPPYIPPGGGFVIYMIHEPDCRADWESDVILAGHTHGGQFRFGNVELLEAMGFVELSGVKERGGQFTYISRGIGTSTTQNDLRFNSAPEIVVITG